MRVQAQVHRAALFPVYHRSALSCARHIWRLDGLRGLYRGLSAQAIRDVPSSGLYFWIYERLVQPDSLLRRPRRPPAPASTPTSDSPFSDRQGRGTDTHSVRTDRADKADKAQSGQGGQSGQSGQTAGLGLGIYPAAFVAGAVAGPVSWIGVMPLDVLKSRLQADPERRRYGGVLDCARKTWRAEGLRAFWRGSSMILIVSLPANAVAFLAYEFNVRTLSGWELHRERYRPTGSGSDYIDSGSAPSGPSTGSARSGPSTGHSLLPSLPQPLPHSESTASRSGATYFAALTSPAHLSAPIHPARPHAAQSAQSQQSAHSQPADRPAE